LGLGLMGLVAGLISIPTAATGQSKAPEGSRVFELRTYTAAPGKLEALHARFRDHTLRLFEKHGMKNVIYLSPTDEQLAGNTLVYLISHASREAADKSWAAFRADPEWQKVRSESEKDGKLVEKVDSQYLTPTDYSPLKK
jgi:hypothetical protein